MRILVVSRFIPWPITGGGRMRLANVISALGSFGDVELFCLVDPLPPLPDPPVARLGNGPFPPRAKSSVLQRGVWLMRGEAPLELADVDFGPARERFTSWAASSYDLVWFHGASAFRALGALVNAPTVLDFADLPDQIITGQLAVLASARDPRGRVRRVGQRLKLAKNARAWHQLQPRMARAVDLATVCSDVDRSRLGVPNALVVPNGCDPPDQPVGRVKVGQPSTIIFQGYLPYPPNADASERLVSEIAPKVRERLPDVRVRLVGTADDRVRDLHDPPRVTVTGFVPDMADELEKADIVAVPIRFGSGTRIKILEAFAHGIPVVSTRTGAEGLDVVDGRHLLFAEGPDDFAHACVELLTDERRRASLADAGRELVEEHYTWSRVQGIIVDAVSRLLHAHA